MSRGRFQVGRVNCDCWGVIYEVVGHCEHVRSFQLREQTQSILGKTPQSRLAGPLLRPPRLQLNLKPTLGGNQDDCTHGQTEARDRTGKWA
jgi:hypothetical protein